MACCIDVMTTMNISLCLVILGVGCWGYFRNKDKTPFNIGVAFGLFAVSHLITLLGLERNFELTMILIRVFAYLIVIFTLYKVEFK